MIILISGSTSLVIDVGILEPSFDLGIIRKVVPSCVHHRLSLSYRGSYRFTIHHHAHHVASTPLHFFMMTMLRHSTEDCFDATFLGNGTAVCIVTSHIPEGVAPSRSKYSWYVWYIFAKRLTPLLDFTTDFLS